MNEFNDNMLFAHEIKDVYKALVEYNNGKSIDELYITAKSFLRMVSSCRDTQLVLSFKYDLNPLIAKYLKESFTEGISKNRIHGRINNQKIADDFMLLYGVERSLLQERLWEIEDLFRMMEVLETIYSHHISLQRRTSMTTSVCRSIYPEVFYNFNTMSIEFSQNPLQLKIVPFLKTVKHAEYPVGGLIFSLSTKQLDRLYKEYNIE